MNQDSQQGPQGANFPTSTQVPSRTLRIPVLEASLRPWGGTSANFEIPTLVQSHLFASRAPGSSSTIDSQVCHEESLWKALIDQRDNIMPLIPEVRYARKSFYKCPDSGRHYLDKAGFVDLTGFHHSFFGISSCPCFNHRRLGVCVIPVQRRNKFTTQAWMIPMIDRWHSAF